MKFSQELTHIHRRGARVWLACLVALPVAAQTTATLLGHVLDPSGTPVAEAVVTAQNIGTGFSRQARTNKDGEYLLTTLPTGSYRVTVAAPGFKTFEQPGVALQVEQNTRVDARLELGQVKETVTVSSAVANVDTESSTLGATVDRVRVANLPLNGLNVLSLATILPGVGQANLPVVVTNSRGGPNMSVSGSRTNNLNIMLDGSTFITAKHGSSQNLPSPDTLEEFRILTNSYSAEYGRTSGGVILAVTKSGTNIFHGSLFEFLRNDVLNARNAFAPSKPFLRQNQFGGTFGGPVRLPHYDGRNRTFFFVSYEGLQIRQQSLNTFSPFTANERAGDFTGGKIIKDPLTGQPFPGNQIPASRFDPLAQNILTDYIPVLPAGQAQLQSLVSIPQSRSQFTTKIDHRISDADSLWVRIFRNLDGSPVTLSSGGNIYALASPRNDLVQSAAVSEIHTFNPALLNEFHGSITRIDDYGPASAANRTPSELGGAYNQDGPIPFAPTVTVQGRVTMTPNQPWKETDNLLQLDDKVSWIHGRHAIKAGLMALYFRTFLQTQFQTSGVFNFDGSFTGNAAADFLLGRPISFAQASIYNDSPRGGSTEFFAQDDIAATSRLKLNVGLRYNLPIPWTERFNHIALIIPGRQSAKYAQAPPGLLYPGDSGVPDSLIPPDRNDFAPRLGFAWDVFGNGRTSVRGAYGIFFVPEYAFYIDRSYENPPNQAGILISSPPSMSNPYLGRADPFPYTPDPNHPVFVTPIEAFTPNPNLRDGYSEQFNLNIQHQFGADFMVQAGYVGQVAHKLSQLRDINPAVYGPGATPANAQQRRPYLPQYYADIGQLNSDANSNYHSLQVLAQKRFSHGYTVQAAYTYAKSIDNASLGIAGSTSLQNPFNYGEGERGLSDFDQRHLLRVNGVWDLPLLENRSRLSEVFGGWRLSGIVNYSAGLPFSVVSGRDAALEGTGRNDGPERPDAVGNAQLDTGRSRTALIQQYFYQAAFALPATGEYGNDGRNNLVGPGSFNTDVGIMKNFKLPAERGAIQFRGEIFNLLNFVNLNNPTNNFSSPTFGRIVGSGAARVVQFALRYDF
ncbi:MAG: carboxypeptidase-like regulatory domain-containing protein [Bryobacteraceae bacterium]